MLRIAVALVALLAGSSASFAQFYEYDPGYRSGQGGYRYRPPVLCYVFAGYERYRSRPFCEISRYQPPGTECACPSYSGGRLPGQVGPR